MYKQGNCKDTIYFGARSVTQKSNEDIKAKSLIYPRYAAEDGESTVYAYLRGVSSRN